MMAVYLAPIPQDPEAQRALEMIIQRETAPMVTASIPAPRLPSLPPLPGATSLRTASLGGGTIVTGALANLFRGTFSAPQQDAPVAQALGKPHRQARKLRHHAPSRAGCARSRACRRNLHHAGRSKFEPIRRNLGSR